MSSSKEKFDDDGFIALSTVDDFDPGNEVLKLSRKRPIESAAVSLKKMSTAEGEVTIHTDNTQTNSIEKGEVKNRYDQLKKSGNSNKNKGTSKSKSKSGVSKMLSASNFLSKFTSGHKKKFHAK